MSGYTKASTMDLGVQTGSRFRHLHANASTFSHAAEIGDTDTVRHLLKAKIDPCIKDSTGDSALHCAAFCGRLEVIEILLEAKADANMTDHYGQKAIDMAVQSKRNDWVKCVEALSVAGCDAKKYERILSDVRTPEDKNDRKKKAQKQASIDKNEMLSIIHGEQTSERNLQKPRSSVRHVHRVKMLFAKKKTRKSVTVKLRRRSSLYARALEAQKKKKMAAAKKLAAEAAQQNALVSRQRQTKIR